MYYATYHISFVWWGFPTIFVATVFTMALGVRITEEFSVRLQLSGSIKIDSELPDKIRFFQDNFSSRGVPCHATASCAKFCVKYMHWYVHPSRDQSLCTKEHTCLNSQVEKIGFFWRICSKTCSAVSGSISISNYPHSNQTRNSR